MDRPQEGVVLGVVWGSAVGLYIIEWPIAGLLLFVAGIVCWKLQNKRRKKMQPSNHSHFDMGLNGPLDVCFRQLDRVNWGLYELGRYSQDAANNLRSLNQDTVGDLNVIIDALAQTLVWFGSEVAQ
jgi:hypothetical protein